MKKRLAREWLVAICFVPLGMFIASYISASAQPASPSEPLSWNLGFAMRGLFTGHEYAANWGHALLPYVVVQFFRLTKWAIREGQPNEQAEHVRERPERTGVGSIRAPEAHAATESGPEFAGGLSTVVKSNAVGSTGSAWYWVARCIRAFFGLIFVLQILQLLPALTWVLDPSSMTDQMLAVALVKLVVLVVCGLIFFGIRSAMNRVHLRNHGSLHPAMNKLWSL